MSLNWQTWERPFWAVFSITLAVLAGFLLHRLLVWLAHRMVTRKGSSRHHELISQIGSPFGVALTLLLVLATLSELRLPREVANPMHHFVLLGVIAAATWLLIRIAAYAETIVAQRYQIEVQDNLVARRVRTQVHFFRQIAEAGVVLAAIAVMLMTFPAIWSVGASILASAGIAGLAVGMAARPALSNLLAGVQIALTQPMRIDDVVIVENEWGRIEEVTTTYVVVRTWDLRRLIVPLSYFIEKPFQNWTRTSADLIGSVFIYTDYSVGVDELRQELKRIVESSRLWDRKTCVLQVTDAKEHTLELRALVSAADSSALWDLRCQTRESLVTFLRERHPEALPRTRAELWNRSQDASATDGDMYHRLTAGTGPGSARPASMRPANT